MLALPTGACGTSSSNVSTDGSVDPDLRAALAEVVDSPTLHFSVEVDAPAGTEVAGEYEVDFEAPDKFRTVSQGDGGNETILTIGNSIFRTADGQSWEQLEVPGSTSPPNLARLLRDPCSSSGSGRRFRVKLRSTAGRCPGPEAAINLENNRVRQITIDVPAEGGTIETVIEMDWSATVRPIEPPSSTQ